MMVVQNLLPAVCSQCGHQHAGPALGGICIGCPCSANVCDVTGALPGRPGPAVVNPPLDPAGRADPDRPHHPAGH